jgi:asparagine synthase (glutamine-hydrolysing)
MCGFIFIHQSNKIKIDLKQFNNALNMQKWRGPDASHTMVLEDGKVLMGHNRLSIIDPIARSDQPMTSDCGRYVIVYNGEIYNHLDIRYKLKLKCKTLSDTETLIEGYALIGERIIDHLDGMFAFVIFDKLKNTWFSARDHLGIKPLYIYDTTELLIIGSEPAPIAYLGNLRHDEESVLEWKLTRRPVPGFSFFKGLNEYLPGTQRKSDDLLGKYYWKLHEDKNMFDQNEFENILINSIKSHELSDVKNVSLLSGGLDSAIVASLSDVTSTYCIGLRDNNEIIEATESANLIGRKINTFIIDFNELKETWRWLVRLRGEPLSVPNEGLIYRICSAMHPEEKVVLTGEGADELLFGYDNIYRWAINNPKFSYDEFLKKYCYSSSTKTTDRLMAYIENNSRCMNSIEFVEDFFYKYHLPCLLRRMDFGSMAASKEARVPFVNIKLISYMYRKDVNIKINQLNSKIPLRKYAEKNGLDKILNRKKIGFSASSEKSLNKYVEYENFQKIVLGELGW